MNPTHELPSAPIGELSERIASTVVEDGRAEPLEGLHFHRKSAPSKLFGVAATGFCVIAQGSKDVFLAAEHYRYDSAHYLLVTSELPVMSRSPLPHPSALFSVCASSSSPPSSVR